MKTSATETAIPSSRAGRSVLFAVLLLACATPERSLLERSSALAQSKDASAATLARAGFHAWLENADARAAANRFDAAIERDPADPLGLLGKAMLARRALDDRAEADLLLAILERAPASPITPLIAGRLTDLAELSPALAESIDSRLAPLLSRGPLRGMAAYRARRVRIVVAEATGRIEAAASLRSENGLVTSYTLAGPCGANDAFDLDRPFPPELGPLPVEFPGPTGWMVVKPRPFSVPDGLVTLEGEPPGGDIYYFASDLRLSRGGDYLLVLSSTATVKAMLDGQQIGERRGYGGFPSSVLVLPRSLAPGAHRLLLKVGRGRDQVALSVAFARADGAPSDVSSAPAAVGAPAAPVRAGPLVEPAWGARQLVRELEPEMGPGLARLVVARDVLDWNRETAKTLLEEALVLLPHSAPVHATRGDALRQDPTLEEKIAYVRASAEYAWALERDPDDAPTRLKSAEIMRFGDRFEDAAELLSGLSKALANRPRALLSRALLAWAQGFGEEAERLAEEARRQGGLCQATGLLYDIADQRDAVAREDQLAASLAQCRGGLQRLADHRHKRGDVAGELAILDRLAKAAPTRIDLHLARGRALTSRREPAAAARVLSELAMIWPRDPRIPKTQAGALELAGDHAGARAAREAALRLDGSDLHLRRAMALEDGKEVLSGYAEDGAAAIRSYQAAGKRPDTSAAVVLDAAAIEAHPDGSTTERVHQIIQVLDQRGVERHGEVSVPSGSEILSIRTIKRDGRRLEPDEPGDKGSISLHGLEPGDYVEYEYLHATPSRGPSIPGFAAPPFFFRVADAPMFRSTYVVLAPRGTGMEVDAHNMPAPKVRMSGEYEVLRAERNQVPPLIAEPDDPSPTEYLPFVVVGAGAGQEALPLAMADLLLDRVRPTVEIRSFALRIAEEAASRATGGRQGEALIRTVYDRVNELILGQGGSWRDSASEVLARGRGNRTVILKAIYDSLGVKSRFALVRPFSADPAPYRFYRPELYSHIVLRVEHDGRTYWLDPTMRLTPFATLPNVARGCEALILPEPGETPTTSRTPEEGDGGRELVLHLSLDPDGSGTVEGVERYLGVEGAAAKASIEQLNDPARRQMVEQSLSQTFRGLSLGMLTVEGEQSMRDPLVLRYRIRVPQLLHVEGNRVTLEGVLLLAQLGKRFLSRAARETPLIIQADERVSLHLEISLPMGMRVAAQATADLTSEFGAYSRVERQEGARGVRDDRFLLRRNRISPEKYGDFARFAAAADEAQAGAMSFLVEPTRTGASPKVPKTEGGNP